MGISKITRNYQITLPKDVRKIVWLKQGDEVMLRIEDGNIIITKSAKDPIMATAGIWGDIGETGAEYQKRIRKGWSRRLKKIYGSTGY